MKVLLVGINAKYIQTNLAVRLLTSWAHAHSRPVQEGSVSVLFREWNINQPLASALRGIYEEKPDVLLFSVYIWNSRFVFDLAAEARVLLPAALIGFGGPEVSWSPGRAFSASPAADFILSGEGELAFSALLEVLDANGSGERERLLAVPGIHLRNSGRQNSTHPDSPAFESGPPSQTLENLDSIAFPYREQENGFDPFHQLVYYESSRGCPFNCAYCMSSLEKSVRFRSLDLVFQDLRFFIENKWPLVKFVDRTFNIKPERYLAIWEWIRDHHAGSTMFHFEIAAELLDDRAFAVLSTMPEGAIQFEIGIQSAHPEILKRVNRFSSPEVLADRIRRIPKTIHVHVDLIAGLPGEDVSLFEESFNFAWNLRSDQLQLGFLKILPGAPMEEYAVSHPEYSWSRVPPYEVYSSGSLSYSELLILKDVEHLLDGWYNSGFAPNALFRAASVHPGGPFRLFLDLVRFVRDWFPDGDLYLPRKPIDIFACLASFLKTRCSGLELEYLKLDYLMMGKPGFYPDWFVRRYSREEHEKAIATCISSSPDEPNRLLFARTEYERLDLSGSSEPEGYFFEYSRTKNNGKRAKMTKV